MAAGRGTDAAADGAVGPAAVWHSQLTCGGVGLLHLRGSPLVRRLVLLVRVHVPAARSAPARGTSVGVGRGAVRGRGRRGGQVGLRTVLRRLRLVTEPRPHLLLPLGNLLAAVTLTRGRRRMTREGAAVRHVALLAARNARA